jgi:hypothetical protein
MKRYVKQTTNTVHYIADIRRENPNVSIPDDADCSEFGYEFLILTPAPSQEGYQAVEVPPVNNVQAWELRPIDAVDTAKVRVQELKRLLADTDYVALTDYDKEKPELLSQRQEWRDEIRTLEASLSKQ